MGHRNEREFFGAIQMGRWVAAFAVLCYHASQSLSSFIGDVPDWLKAVSASGFLGVDFFFVLSGFIIYYSHSSDERSIDALSRFGHRRFIRIYVPYLPIALALALAYHLLPGLSAGNRDWSLLKTLTLLPLQGEAALSVAWTLVHEVVFYAIFGLLFYGRMLAVGTSAWAGCIVGYNLLGLDLGPASNVVFHVLNLEFLFGVAAAYLLRKLPPTSGALWIALGVVLAAPMLFLAPEGPARIVFGLGMALVILGAVLGEREGWLKPPSVSLQLGAVSYALYLLHVPILSITSRAGALFGLGWSLTLLMSLATCCAAAFAYFGLIEKPLMALVRKRVASTEPAPATDRLP